jgi:hypothetical protein
MFLWPERDTLMVPTAVPHSIAGTAANAGGPPVSFLGGWNLGGSAGLSPRGALEQTWREIQSAR